MNFFIIYMIIDMIIYMIDMIMYMRIFIHLTLEFSYI